MQNNRRQFHIFDLEIAARKAGATVPTMNNIIPILQRMKDNAKIYSIRANTGTMLIGDMMTGTTQKFVTLLIRLSDKTTPNSVYSDPAAGQYDEHIKSGNTGSDFGCHVLISITPEKTQPNIYTCAIERIPGLPFELVRRLLSKLLHYEFKDDPTSFSYRHPAGGLDGNMQPRMDRCCPHIELRGRPSDTLVSDINAGRISGISLVKSEPVTPIAGASYLKKSESELKLSIDHNNLPKNLWDSLTKAFKQNAQNYSTANVKYRTPESSRIVTVKIDTKTSTLLNEMYILHFEIKKISPLLAQSAQKIVPHLHALALPQFLANRTI